MEHSWARQRGSSRPLILAWMVWDFFKVNIGYSEDVLLSSREGVDELFAESGKPKGH